MSRKARNHANDLRGASQLAVDATRGVTSLVEAMHVTIAGGPAILEECRRLGGCETGDAKATGAGELPARYVIHTVGPVWRGGDHDEDGLLASCHRRSLQVAAELECRAVAFPAISTGVYGFPVARAARIAIGTAAEELDARPAIEQVTFVLFGRDAYAEFDAALREL